jgi:putative endonuclease
VFESFFKIFRIRRHSRLPQSDSEIGAWGEDFAAQFLQRAGYRVLERNWKCPLGEFDLICRHGDVIVFVEVKSSLKLAAVPPERRVNPRKQHKLHMLARYYIKHKATQLPCRFDVVAVWWENQQPQIRHIENAFQPL